MFIFNEKSSPTLFVIQAASLEALYNINIGGLSTVATENSAGAGTYFTNSGPDNLFDNANNTYYTSRGNFSGVSAVSGLYTGFHVTIAQCQPTLVTFRIATGSTSAYDPLTIALEGTNCNDLLSCTSWLSLYNGTSGLTNIADRGAFGNYLSIPSPQSFTGYRLTVLSKRSSGAWVSYSAVEFYGY
ncbi:unnamed protein product [Adineta steineri]|uniref:Uncharacterized protein n=1 Tax=Adineta steineri TaxID=433720 RepID=A0A819U153_9BILA|nr:unnamed protein product [Adineta steineri]